VKTLLCLLWYFHDWFVDVLIFSHKVTIHRDNSLQQSTKEFTLVLNFIWWKHKVIVF
jgi:hypothetical protein